MMSIGILATVGRATCLRVGNSRLKDKHAVLNYLSSIVPAIKKRLTTNHLSERIILRLESCGGESEGMGGKG